MFIATLFITVKKQKQPKCLWTDEKVNKRDMSMQLNIIQSKKDELLTHVTTWMNLENVTYLREDSHKGLHIV